MVRAKIARRFTALADGALPMCSTKFSPNQLASLRLMNRPRFLDHRRLEFSGF